MSSSTLSIYEKRQNVEVNSLMINEENKKASFQRLFLQFVLVNILNINIIKDCFSNNRFGIFTKVQRDDTAAYLLRQKDH